jgi:hypothetical protein
MVRPRFASMTVVFATLILGAAGTPPAHAQPQACPVGATSEAGACIVRLASVAADSADGSLTGTPIGGTTPITVFGEPESYRASEGFGDSPPDAVQQWDATIARVMDPPNSDYGQSKARAFLPRQLNALATLFPPGTVVLRSAPDPADPHLFVLQSIQPIAP